LKVFKSNCFFCFPSTSLVVFPLEKISHKNNFIYIIRRIRWKRENNTIMIVIITAAGRTMYLKKLSTYDWSVSFLDSFFEFLRRDSK